MSFGGQANASSPSSPCRTVEKTRKTHPPGNPPRENDCFKCFPKHQQNKKTAQNRDRGEQIHHCLLRRAGRRVKIGRRTIRAQIGKHSLVYGQAIEERIAEFARYGWRTVVGTLANLEEMPDNKEFTGSSGAFPVDLKMDSVYSKCGAVITFFTSI